MAVHHGRRSNQAPSPLPTILEREEYYVEVDLAGRTLTVATTTFTPSNKVWELLKELADAKRHTSPDLKPTEWKNAVDMLRKKIDKVNLRFVVESTQHGYRLASNVKVTGGGQVGVRKTTQRR